MSTYDILGIAAGLVTFYLVLSLLCTAINELLAAALDSRKRYLKEGLTPVLGSDLSAFFDDPLINSLRTRNAGSSVSGGAVKDWPSYIPRETAALAIENLLAMTVLKTDRLDNVSFSALSTGPTRGSLSPALAAALQLFARSPGDLNTFRGEHEKVVRRRDRPHLGSLPVVPQSNDPVRGGGSRGSPGGRVRDGEGFRGAQGEDNGLDHSQGWQGSRGVPSESRRGRHSFSYRLEDLERRRRLPAHRQRI